MKPTNSIIFILIIFFLYSCCTKKDCDSIGLEEIEFYNFNKNDLDTVIIYSYSKNSNFTMLIDSITTHDKSDLPDYDYVNTYKIISDYDFIIYLPNTGQTFKITAVNTEKKGCNTCFPYRPKSDYYNVISSYNLNGQPKFESQIKIYN